MDFTDQALKMAGALSVVVALLLGGGFLVKRLFGEGQCHLRKSMLRLLGGLRLGQGKSIMLVEVAGEVLVLGTTTRDLTLLSRVTDEARIEQLKNSPVNGMSGVGLFSTIHWKPEESLTQRQQETT